MLIRVTRCSVLWRYPGIPWRDSDELRYAKEDMLCIVTNTLPIVVPIVGAQRDWLHVMCCDGAYAWIISDNVEHVL